MYFVQTYGIDLRKVSCPVSFSPIVQKSGICKADCFSAGLDAWCKREAFVVIWISLKTRKHIKYPRPESSRSKLWNCWHCYNTCQSWTIYCFISKYRSISKIGCINCFNWLWSNSSNNNWLRSTSYSKNNWLRSYTNYLSNIIAKYWLSELNWKHSRIARIYAAYTRLPINWWISTILKLTN